MLVLDCAYFVCTHFAGRSKADINSDVVYICINIMLILLFITYTDQILLIHLIIFCSRIISFLQGKDTWTTKSIVDLIEKEGDSIALVLFSGNISILTITTLLAHFFCFKLQIMQNLRPFYL